MKFFTCWDYSYIEFGSFVGTVIGSKYALTSDLRLRMQLRFGFDFISGLLFLFAICVHMLPFLILSRFIQGFSMGLTMSLVVISFYSINF